MTAKKSSHFSRKLVLIISLFIILIIGGYITKIWTAIIVSAEASGIPKPGDASPKTDGIAKNPCWTFSLGGPFIYARMAMIFENTNVNFKFPLRTIVNPWDRHDGEFEDIYFQVEYSTFKPLTAPETPGKDSLTFLIGDIISLNQVIKIYINESIPGPNKPITEFSTKHALYGLTEIVGDPIKQQKVFYVDTPDFGSINTFIECNIRDPHWAPFPQCTEHFRASGIDVKTSFSQTHLKQWREIKHAVTEFLFCAKSN